MFNVLEAMEAIRGAMKAIRGAILGAITEKILGFILGTNCPSA
jgi:hypothetical protein